MNCLIRNTGLISKFMTSQPGYQTIAMHILPNSSRSKCNQTKKFGRLMEKSMRNNFLEKSYTKYVLKLFPEKSKLSISLDQ